MTSPGDGVDRSTPASTWLAAGRDASAATAGAVVGLALGGEAGAVVGAALPPVALAAIDGFWGRWQGRRREAAGRVLLTAATVIGVSVDDVLVKAETRADLELLAGKAMAAGASTASEAKIEALGRALAKALQADSGGSYDEAAALIDVLSQIEAPHIRVLEFFLDPSTQYVELPIPEVWSEFDVSGHEVESVTERFPEYGDTVHGVVAALERLGLIRAQAPNLSEAMSEPDPRHSDFLLRQESVLRLAPTKFGFMVYQRVSAIARDAVEPPALDETQS